jgi:hypothetical protein
MGSLARNEVVRIAQHVRNGEERKEGKDGVTTRDQKGPTAVREATQRDLGTCLAYLHLGDNKTMETHSLERRREAMKS